MTTFNPGDVVLVRFPFTDLSSSKRRPALVISSANYAERYGDLVLLPITSRPQPDAALRLQEWEKAGLPKESWLKPLIATITLTLVSSRLGTIAPLDGSRVRAALSILLAAEFRA